MSSGDPGGDDATLRLDDWLDAFNAELQPLSPPPGLLDHGPDNASTSTPFEDALACPNDGNRSRDTPPPPTRRPRRRRPSGSDNNKIARDALRIQVRELVDTLEVLRERHFGSSPLPAALDVFNERRKRHCAERECEQLRVALATQTRFLCSLRSALTSCIPKVDLYRFLHRYTRLPSDRSVRLTEYAALTHISRLHTARDLLSRETACVAAASAATPYIETELTVDSQGCSVATRAVYAFDTHDVGAVVQGVCVAVGDVVPKCLAYRTMGSSRRIVDADTVAALTAEGNQSIGDEEPPTCLRARTKMTYSVMRVHHQSLDYDSSSSPDELSIESRVVMQFKRTDNTKGSTNDSEMVVLWDFVDDDELYPPAAGVDITRQCTGACIVRREICDDGIDRVVYRSMSSRLYRFRDDPAKGALVRFVGITEGAMKTHELLFRAIINEQLGATNGVVSPLHGSNTAL